MSEFSLKTSLSKEELQDKIKGVIFGKAIGDGIGLATEFMYKDQATLLYGNGPIKFGNAPGHEFWRDACRNGWFENDFTDDTDQMLLILQSLLENNGILNPINFAHRLKEWTKVGFPELNNKLPNGIGYTVGSSTKHKDFLTDPLRVSYDVWNKNDRNLSANGGIMRSAVTGVPYFYDERKVVENSMLAAKVTHADPRSVVSAVISSVIISRLLRGSSSSVTKKNGVNEAELTEMIEFGSTEDNSYLEKFEGISVPQPKDLNTPLHRSLLREVRRCAANLKGEPLNPLFEADFSIPKHEPVDIKRFDNPAPIRPNIKLIDDYGSDPNMMELCKDVVNEYKFLVETNSLCPDTNTAKGDQDQNEAASSVTSAPTEASWVDQLYAHSFPESLSSLKLNERSKIGYSLKCLGAALYLATRKIPEDMTAPEFFENTITQLLLETGDADTNCAAAGAILGCRLGNSGLPKEWVEGLRHYDFLEKISDELCQMVLARMEMDKSA